MKNIVVLIDFSEGSKMALVQAAALAERTHANLSGLHIVSTQGKVSEAKQKLEQFITDTIGSTHPADAVVEIGSLNVGTQDALRKLKPDLVVICTHGIKGLQHIFGAQILKLVQAIPYPSIVIHENCKIDLANTQKILFPVGPHPEYMVKVKQASHFAKAINATLVVYEINRPETDYENVLSKNLEEALEYFETNGIPYQKVIEDVKLVSVGFSRQTIDYASANGISIIALMATVSKNEILFGIGDKENFLVNEQGISILTCNM